MTKIPNKLTPSQVTERTVRAAVEGGDLTKTVITIGEEDQELEEGQGPATVGRAPSNVQRRSSRASDIIMGPKMADHVGSPKQPALEQASRNAAEAEESHEVEGQTRSRPLQLPAKMGSKIPRRHQQVLTLAKYEVEQSIISPHRASLV